MPNGWIEWAGVLGLIVACVLAVLQWAQFRWTKRSFREQREEGLKVRATYNPPLREIRPTWILQVWVVNASSVPVFIKSVGLMYVARETAGAYIIRQRSEGDNLLAAGDERYYALFGNDYDDLPDLATLPRDSVFIDVATPEKTILRVPGDDIMFIRSAHPEDGSASPPA